tara:strand:+ start:676 stop:891 length:216 start_codon:yes stop_codon:yes gene_type:complete
MEYKNKKVLFSYYKEVVENKAEEMKSKTINLVMYKYEKKLQKCLAGTRKNPIYMAWVDNKCNVSVKSGNID